MSSPLRGGSVTVQQDAAGVWGVPSLCLLYLPQEWGTREVPGLDQWPHVLTLLALVPPRLGDTGGLKELGFHPNRHPGQARNLTLTLAAGFASLYPPDNGTQERAQRFVSADSTRGVQGARPSAFLSIPQEWGTRGLT